MSMPAPGGRQHDIAGRHIDALAVHHGIDIVGGIEHETAPPQDMVPGVTVVGNGWISLMAYQAKGYAYIGPDA
jgi:intracellular sulfur oxidation DsrE/DsrF family protein